MKRLTACLTLRLLPGIGPITAQRLVAAYGSPEAIFDSKPIPEQPPNERLLTLLRKGSRVQKEVQSIEQWIRKEKLRPLLWGTEEYPLALARCPDAPLVLFCRGNLSWESRRWVAVVGTRRPSTYGVESCQALLKELAPFHPVIVSGLAFGVDAVAHKAALKEGMDTVACLPQALGLPIYPAPHQGLAEKIRQQGALVSDFIPQQGFERGHFVQRNRLIAGLCQATLVIESGATGGSLITANFASQYDRELFALPGPVHSAKSKGCHSLIQLQQAQLLDSIDIVVETLGWGNTKKTTQQSLPLDLSEAEEKVYFFLLQKGKQDLDFLAKSLALTISETAILLMQLEMKKRYALCLANVLRCVSTQLCFGLLRAPRWLWRVHDRLLWQG